MEVEPDAQKEAPITLETGRGLHVRSAFVLNHLASRWEEENRFLKSLRPAKGDTLARSVRAPVVVGVHVRMAGGQAFEQPACEGLDNWSRESQEAIARWRARSGPDRFLTRLEALAAAILAARTERLLGSTWSSFSELAMHLAGPDQTVEMPGRDF